MKLTEEMIAALPMITEEELEEIRIPTDELVQLAIDAFKEADRIDEMFENGYL